MLPGVRFSAAESVRFTTAGYTAVNAGRIGNTLRGRRGDSMPLVGSRSAPFTVALGDPITEDQ